MIRQLVKEAKTSPLLLAMVLILGGGGDIAEIIEQRSESETEQALGIQIATMQGQINLLTLRIQQLDGIDFQAKADDMELKDDSIQVNGLSNGLTVALMVANQVYAENGYAMVITSLNDGMHSRTSLHYSGNAVDIRTKTIEQMADKTFVTNEIRSRLNVDYDVILEGVGDANEHLHIEYQPRRRDS